MDVNNKNYYQEDGKAHKVNSYFAKDFQPALNRAQRRKLARKNAKTLQKEKEKIKMSKLTKLIQGHTGGNESFNNILKEALLLDRKCQNLELALTIAADTGNYVEDPKHPGFGMPEIDLPEYWLQQAVEQINNEQNNPN
jgi:hypothetical protein